MQNTTLFPGMEDSVVVTCGAEQGEAGPPRLRRPDRSQIVMEPCCLEDRLAPDHPARIIWQVVKTFDLSAFYARIAARGSDPGRAAQERAARDRTVRLEAALAEFPKIEEIRARQCKAKQAKHREPQVSTTDPEARKMKMGNGGFNPAYNVQTAMDTQSRAILAIEVTNHGCDYGEDSPLRAQVKRRTGQMPKEHLLDGGYIDRKGIEQASRDGVDIYMPLPKTAGQGQVCRGYQGDSPGVTAWRRRMLSEEGREIYKLRASTSETVNADLKAFQGLHAFAVRGLAKVRCVALWSALAYNIMHFTAVLVT